MEVLRLSVDYDGYYGGDIHEYCLLPIEWNGLYAEKLDEGTHERAIYLGEIEGKHSEVYGDLTVEIIDVSSLNHKEFSGLVDNTSTCEFEITFEGWEDDFKHEFEDDEDELERIRKMQIQFEKRYSFQYQSEYVIKTDVISQQFTESLKLGATQLETITIKTSDKNKVIAILSDNGIETF